MSAFARYFDINFIGTRHIQSRTESGFTRFDAGHHVLAYHDIHFWILKYALGNHKRCAAGKPFFARLKNKFYRTFKFVFQFC